MIKLVVGLGNPGSQYEKTRHNAGFVFLNHLAVANGLIWQANSQFQGDVAECSVAGDKLILLKPMTFMNKSGDSVGKVLRYFKFKPENLLVVHDELELPEGVVKLKRDGGHAGHNGLRDIIAHIDTRDFFRLRIGIGRPAVGSNIANYVLSKPDQSGCLLIESVCEQLVRRLEILISADIVKVNELLPVRL